MWRELITELHRGVEPIGDLDPGPDFSPGATPAYLASVERQLGVNLTRSLRELLAESNGVHVLFDTPLIWSTAEMISHNIEMRTQPEYHERFLPFDHLLFFASAAVDGILFAFGLIRGEIKQEDIYAWYPIDGERLWKAPSLQTYVEWWLTGKLSV